MGITVTTFLMTVLLGALTISVRQDTVPPPDAIQLPTVTLFARKIIGGYDTYTRAAFSFEFGMNGDDSLKITRNDWDLLYGNLNLDGSRDWLTVNTVTDDRSRIQDLGELHWSDDMAIPILPACPDDDETCVAVKIPSSLSGQSITDVNTGVARAVLGHMYVAHTKDSNSDLYALFRVDKLHPSVSCTISWKLVPSPEH